LLRSWLARPLLQVKSIQQRQIAIKDLKVSVGLFYFVQG
jgi:DNA mismatch repair ATPase MutS